MLIFFIKHEFTIPTKAMVLTKRAILSEKVKSGELIFNHVTDTYIDDNKINNN